MFGSLPISSPKPSESFIQLSLLSCSIKIQLQFRGVYMTFQIIYSKNAMSKFISYDSGHCSGCQWYSCKRKEKKCIFSHYFLTADELATLYQKSFSTNLLFSKRLYLQKLTIRSCLRNAQSSSTTSLLKKSNRVCFICRKILSIISADGLIY